MIPRDSKYNLDICFLQIRVKNALFSKYKKIDQTCNDWRNRDWYIDQSRQKFFPFKLKSQSLPRLHISPKQCYIIPQ